MAPKRTRGVTLIEVIVAIAIAAILVGVAAPSFVDSIARTRLEGAASTLASDIQYTRSEAIRRSGKHADATQQGAALAVDAAGTAYSITVKPAEGGADVTLKTVSLPDGVKLPANKSIKFDSLRGTVTATESLLLQSTQVTNQLQINVTLLGRVSVCSPSGSFMGYTSC